MKKIGIVFSLLLGWSLAQAQETFYGTMVFNYSISGEGSELLTSLFPQQLTIVYGENAMLTLLDGGRMSSMVGKAVNNQGESYVINDEKKTVYVLSDEDIKQVKVPKTNKITALDEPSRKIMGYTCRAYWIEMVQDGQQINQKVWATKELQLPEVQGTELTTFNQGIIGLKDLDAFPLEIEMEMAAVPIKMKMMVIELQAEKLQADFFAKPEGYTEKPYADLMKALKN